MVLGQDSEPWNLNFGTLEPWNFGTHLRFTVVQPRLVPLPAVTCEQSDGPPT